MTRSPRLVGLASAVLVLTFASTANAQSSCGSRTKVVAGETLADVAQRCDVTVDALLQANPDLRPGVIAAGTEIDMPGLFGGDVLGRARDAVRGATTQIEGAARQAGKSASEYLSENPDLNRDILEFGERLGLPGVEAGPEIGADLTVSPRSGRPGDQITIRASGLRGETEATIGAGPPDGGYRALDRATTTAAGRIELTLTIPQWAANEERLIFVVETDRVRITSEPIDIIRNM